MSHYFINDDSLKSEKRIIKYTINSHYFELTSDIGVFSKNELDPGSELLIKTAIKEGIKGELLDVGCGYGPIGITLSKTCDLDKVDFIDVNLRALNLTKENAVKYKVKNFNVFESNGFENVKNLYDYILINPPIRAGKQVVFAIYDGSFERLVSGGELWVVIQKKQGAPSSKAHLEELFGNCEIVDKDKGYYILKSIKK